MAHGPVLSKLHDFGNQHEEIIVRPVGDLHYGNPFQNETAVKELIREIKSTPNMFWVGCGDYLELNTKKQPHAGIFTDTLSPKEQMEAFLEDWSPIADRCLCLIEGNHDFRMTKEFGISPTELMAKEMQIEDVFVPDGAVVRVRLGRISRSGGRLGKDNGQPCRYVLYVTHGSSSAATASGKVSALEAAGKAIVADVIIGAHVHSEVVFKDRIYVPTFNDKKNVAYRDRYFVNTGSFIEYGGYALTARYTPQPPGCPQIFLEGRREKVRVTI